MNASTDLYPVGEAYAELDLVVRQLDDGSLTVADDDSLPDGKRLQVRATDEGLKAQIVVAKAPALNEGLSKALDYLNDHTPSSYAWRAGSIYCEATLPWAGEGANFPTPQLKQLYEGVNKEASARGGQLEQIATGLAEWTVLENASGAAAEEPAAVAVPPSYLPGAGQLNAEDRATVRYGGADEVPGRPELKAAERRRPSGGGVTPPVAAPRPSVGGGGGAPAKVIMGLCVLLALAVGAGLALRGREEDAPPPTPPISKTPVPDTPDTPDTPGDDEPEGIDLSGPIEDTPPRDTPPRDTPPVDRPSTEIRLDTEQGIWNALGSGDAEMRKRALEAWIGDQLYRGEGSRKRLLVKLNRRYDRLVNPILTQLFEEHPVPPQEALACLELANLPLRRILIRQIGDSQLPPSDAEIVAEMLAEQKDTGDLLVELALVKLGFPKPGAAVRLIQARGPEWAAGGEGREVMKRLAGHDPSTLEPLADHADERMRILACELFGSVGGKQALIVLTKLLADSDERVRRRAVEAFQEMNDPKSSWALAKRLMQEEDTRTKSMIRDAISRLPSEDTARYLRLLYTRSKTPDGRLAAVEALSAQGHPAGVAGIIRALRDADAKVQLEAMMALRRLQKQPALSDSVAQGLSEIRRVALTAKDKDLRKAARQLHYTVAGRFPK